MIHYVSLKSQILHSRSIAIINVNTFKKNISNILIKSKLVSPNFQLISSHGHLNFFSGKCDRLLIANGKVHFSFSISNKKHIDTGRDTPSYLKSHLDCLASLCKNTQ